jgi:hypothetical protein
MRIGAIAFIRSRAVGIALFVIFCGLSAANLVRGGEVGPTHFYVFAMTGFLLEDVLRRR